MIIVSYQDLIDRVRELGVDKYIQQQLNPDTIAESPILAERLATLGAIDGLSVVVPYREPTYYTDRPTIAIPQPGPTSGAIDCGREYPGRSIDYLIAANAIIFKCLLSLVFYLMVSIESPSMG